MTKKDITIAEYLAVEGTAFSIELNERNRHYFDDHSEDYFAVAAAISLCWTGHAKYEDEFIKYAAKFISGKISKDNTIASMYALRFGEEKLDTSLTGFRAYFNRTKNIMPDFRICSVQDMNRVQIRLLNLLNGFRISGEVTGIGTWLFLGPFKIILEDQQRLWNLTGLGSITMPTGYEVNKGIIRLKNEGYTFMRDFDLNWLSDTNSLLDNYATCLMVHDHILKIANVGKTSALHINSALYKYGKDEI